MRTATSLNRAPWREMRSWGRSCGISATRWSIRLSLARNHNMLFALHLLFSRSSKLVRAANTECHGFFFMQLCRHCITEKVSSLCFVHTWLLLMVCRTCYFCVKLLLLFRGQRMGCPQVSSATINLRDQDHLKHVTNWSTGILCK